jgi:hypothetical protein
MLEEGDTEPRVFDELETLALDCPPVIREALPAREEPNELGLDAAGGVMRLTTGREIARAGAPAAGRPAFGPNLLCMVGLAFTRFSAGAFRIALAFTRTVFPRTGNPRSSVPRETALNPPRTFKLA